MLVPTSQIEAVISPSMRALLEKLKQITPIEVMGEFDRIDIFPTTKDEVYKLTACFFRGTPAINGHFQLIAMKVAMMTDN